MRERTLAALLLMLLPFAVTGCGAFGEDSGTCVSSPVEFSFGLRVYCYNDFDESECDERDAMRVNGADDWFFHGGQTCADRDLEEGSNPWP